MGDWAWVTRLIPLDLDGVTLGGRNGIRNTGLSVDVADNVLACDIGHRAVGRRHANASLITRSLAIDPELMEVLVSGHSRNEGRSENGLGEHGVCQVSDPGSRKMNESGLKRVKAVEKTNVDRVGLACGRKTQGGGTRKTLILCHGFMMIDFGDRQPSNSIYASNTERARTARKRLMEGARGTVGVG